MLGLGWTEILIIAVVALIVVGPRDLPKLLGQVGRTVGTLRRMGNDFRREFNKAVALDEVRDLRKSIAEPLNTAASEIRREFSGAAKPVTQTPVVGPGASAAVAAPSTLPATAAAADVVPAPAAVATTAAPAMTPIVAPPIVPIAAGTVAPQEPRRVKAAPRKSPAKPVEPAAETPARPVATGEVASTGKATSTGSKTPAAAAAPVTKSASGKSGLAKSGPAKSEPAKPAPAIPRTRKPAAVQPALAPSEPNAAPAAPAANVEAVKS